MIILDCQIAGRLDFPFADADFGSFFAAARSLSRAITLRVI
jgi:hypothetical protein